MMGLSSFLGEAAESCYDLNGTYVCIIGVRKIEVPDVTDFIRSIRNFSETEVTTQAINARAAFGIDHLLGVLKITLECQKRSITISMKPEIDLLLRLSLTNQISLAMNRTGLKRNNPAVIIAYSTDKKKVINVGNIIVKMVPHIDNAVLKISKESRDHILELMNTNKQTHIRTGHYRFLTDYLIEQSALVMK
jgi:tRNA threonylcarbamoyladenosine modification (KEOPS) complex Cgi121 subunit